MMNRNYLLVIVALGACGSDGADGADGTAGANGTNGTDTVTLVSVVDEPAGANCPSGGVAINSGIDDDGSGVLDTAEIDATSYVCDDHSSVFFDNLIVVDAAGLAELAGYSVVVGNVTISPAALTGVTALDLSGLQQVVGDLRVNDDGTTLTVDLSALSRVYGDVLINDAVAATSINLTALKAADSLDINNTGNAASLLIPSLKEISTAFLIRNGSDLGDLTAPALVTIDSHFDINNAVVDNIIFAALIDIGGSLLINNAVVGNITFAALIDIGGSLLIQGGSAIGDVNISAVTSIGDGFDLAFSSAGAIDLASLTTIVGALRIAGVGSSLTSIDLSELRSVGSRFVVNGVTGITALAAPKLETVFDFNVTGTSLVTLSFALLIGSDKNFELVNNAVLTTASFPALDTVGDGDAGDSFIIFNNDALDTITFTALRDIDAGAFIIRENNSLACAAIEAVAQAVFDDGGAASYILTANVATADCTNPT